MLVNRRALANRSAVVPAVSALLGGLVALGGVALTGDLGGGTTTVVRTSPAPAAAAQVAHDQRLTVAEIYDRAASGVVQITSRTSSTSDDVQKAFPVDPSDARRCRTRRSARAS